MMGRAGFYESGARGLPRAQYYISKIESLSGGVSNCGATSSAEE